MPKKRAHGEGTIYFWKDKNLWVGKYTLPDGKRKTKYGKTQKEITDWLLETRTEFANGVYLKDDKITLGEFLQRYLEDYGRVSLRPTTYESYQSLINRHVLPEIGNIKLSQLGAGHLNHLYSKKLQQGLSNRTVEYIHGVLRRALNKAVRWGLISKNPTDQANPPKVKSTLPKTWTSEQVKIFLDHVKDDRWAGIYYLACGTGMRKGEILGLPLSALNLENGTLKVIRTVSYVAGQGLIFSEPKTQKGRRMVVLPGFVVDAMYEHLAKREMLAQSPKWQEHDLVFTTNIGTPISPRNMIRHFKTKIKEVGLPDIRFHDLRHTTASLLLEKNVHPKIVSELLGHSSITLTLNTYSHIINPLGREAADKMDEIVGQ